MPTPKMVFRYRGWRKGWMCWWVTSRLPRSANCTVLASLPALSSQGQERDAGLSTSQHGRSGRGIRASHEGPERCLPEPSPMGRAKRRCKREQIPGTIGNVRTGAGFGGCLASSPKGRLPLGLHTCVTFPRAPSLTRLRPATLCPSTSASPDQRTPPLPRPRNPLSVPLLRVAKLCGGAPGPLVRGPAAPVVPALGRRWSASRMRAGLLSSPCGGRGARDGEKLNGFENNEGSGHPRAVTRAACQALACVSWGWRPWTPVSPARRAPLSLVRPQGTGPRAQHEGARLGFAPGLFSRRSWAGMAWAAPGLLSLCLTPGC